jgi:SAM-dependent methyltransferase
MSAQDYYDRYWTDEGYNPRRSGAPAFLEHLFEEQVRADDDCLDLGCGDGGTSGPYLVEHARSYVGVDVSPSAVELAQARGLDVRLIDDATSLAFPDGTFDVVVCSEVLEHLFEPQRAAAEAFRVLRPGGRLIATVPNAAYWRDRVDAVLGLWQPGGDNRARAEPWRSPHIRFFHLRTLRRMLLEAGFDHVHVEGIAAPLLGRVPLVRRISRAPGTPAHLATRLAPSLFGGTLVAVATRP